MLKENGLGLWMELLRPLEWIEHYGAEPGRTIPVELEEMGAVGEALVLAVGPCPPIQTGSGSVVIGTFKHEVQPGTQIVQLELEGQPEPTGVTANHPYWSADRWAFVEAGQLRPGERVDTLYGLKRVIRVTPIPHDGFLYNLETTEHVYRVGSLGTLVHNNDACIRLGVRAPRDARGRFIRGAGGYTAEAARGQAAHINYRNALGAKYDYKARLPSGARPDAVDWKNRIVRELKPDKPRAIRDGWRQLERYRKELERMTGVKWTAYLDTYKP